MTSDYQNENSCLVDFNCTGCIDCVFSSDEKICYDADLSSCNNKRAQIDILICKLKELTGKNVVLK